MRSFWRGLYYTFCVVYNWEIIRVAFNVRKTVNLNVTITVNLQLKNRKEQ